MEVFKKLYVKPEETLWQGRIDGQERMFCRWHQILTCVDLNDNPNLDNAVVLLGFCSDEGVRRNSGREGAKAAPDYLRKVLANLPIHFSENIRLLDAGNIHTNGYDLESAQQALQWAVTLIKEAGGFPLLIGGGHEITYGHFKGLQSGDRSLGVINIDAHLDMRPLVDGKGNSGTSFYQLNKELFDQGKVLQYLAIGIQEISNTQGLIQYAESQGVDIIFAEDIQVDNLQQVKARIDGFVNRVDDLYLTIDMDAFSASFAPGVSAVALGGLIPDNMFYSILKHIYAQPKLISLDIAELNPRFDLDERTARLAANFIFHLFKNIS